MDKQAQHSKALFFTNANVSTYACTWIKTLVIIIFVKLLIPFKCKWVKIARVILTKTANPSLASGVEGMWYRKVYQVVDYVG